jgi:hypothetical protein
VRWRKSLSIFLFTLLVIGCGEGSHNKLYDSVDQIEQELKGKHQKVVVATLGKPDHIFPKGTFNDRSDDEVWTYYDTFRHPVTGQKQKAEVHFAKGICIQIDKD